jgi:ribonuclease HI
MEHAVDEEVGTASIEWLSAIHRIASVYSDGGVFRPRACEAGSWAWIGVDESNRRVAYQYGLIEGRAVTNNLCEYAALLRALESVVTVVPGWSGRACSDSGVTIGRFSEGWRTVGIPQSWVERMHRVWERAGEIEYVLHKGHPTKDELQAGVGVRERSGRSYPVSHHQVLCDRLCTQVLNDWAKRSGAVRGR